MPAQTRPDPAGDRLFVVIGCASSGVYGLGGNTRDGGGSGNVAGAEWRGKALRSGSMTCAHAHAPSQAGIRIRPSDPG
jgi:hypothetical protein